MSQVLVVDDEPQLLRALVLNLSNRGYDVVTAQTAQGAIDQIGAFPPDVVILDLGLPDQDGLDVIRQLHVSRPDIPVIVLSARSGSQAKVSALDLGAVDYVEKPFDMNELLARLRAALRRTGDSSSGATVTLADITVDLDAWAVRDGTTIVRLTPTEWRILDVLLRNPGRLVTSARLLTAVGRHPDHTERSYLRIYMAQLRRKIEEDPGRPRFLLTEPGMGYRFQP
ncbi:MAG: DNA-binding response regulator [Pseudonocardiales bacterium]|nr:DNA-binding response regulator [Pseudonocardiales bacterium]